MSEESIQRVQDELRRHPVIIEALDLLARELPTSLRYHALPHTEDVLNEAIRFGVMDGLSARELELLAVAAAWHDVGFVRSLVSNEPIGAAFARERMEKHGGYTADEVALVERMILDTALVSTEAGSQQIPSSTLSRYLLDADLSNLGREDFFEKAELLRLEVGEDVVSFRKNSLAFVNAHQWHTPAGRCLRQKRQEENLALLRAMVEAPYPT